MEDDIKSFLDQYEKGEISLGQYWELLKESAKQKRADDFSLKEPPAVDFEPLTSREKEVISKMQSVSFGSFTTHKRFITQIEKVTELSSRQREYLRRIFFRYRRQLGLSDVEALEINKQMEKERSKIPG